MSGRSQSRGRTAAVLFTLAACSFVAQAQPAGPTVRFGGATFQQLGHSLLVTTTNGAGTLRSVIDWRSFSVPQGSVTHFLQPSADSTSINRVTGNKPSEIFGTLSSNGHLVLVNPSGIAVGTGAVIDTAGFTASALGMSDDDAFAGRLRYRADKGKGEVDVRGRILARGGDVVLLGTSVQVDKDAIVQAPNGAVILAAGQQVAFTARGLEGIVLELTAPGDKAVNLGRLEAGAVGMFASQLRHTGAIQAGHVILQGDKVRLEQGGKDKDKEKDKDKDKPGNPGNGNAGGSGNNGNNGENSGSSGNTGSGGGTASGGTASPPPDDIRMDNIVITDAGSGNTSGGGSHPSSSPPAQSSPPPASSPQAQVLLAAMQSHAAATILNNGEVVAGLKAPELPAAPADRPARARPDPALQCTR